MTLFYFWQKCVDLSVVDFDNCYTTHIRWKANPSDSVVQSISSFYMFQFYVFDTCIKCATLWFLSDILFQFETCRKSNILRREFLTKWTSKKRRKRNRSGQYWLTKEQKMTRKNHRIYKGNCHLIQMFASSIQTQKCLHLLPYENPNWSLEIYEIQMGGRMWKVWRSTRLEFIMSRHNHQWQTRRFVAKFRKNEQKIRLTIDQNQIKS